MEKKRLYYYDNLRVLLIYLVLVGHFCEISAGNTNYGSFLSFFIYIFHMPLFVFISGLFHSNDSRDKIIHRSVGFLLIYFLMKIESLLDHMILYGGGKLNLFNEGGMPWFMLTLSAWTLMAYITRNFNKKMLLAVSVLVALACGYDYSLTTQFSISRIIVFWPFYLGGVMVDKETLLSVMEKRSIKLIGTVFLTVSIIALWVTQDKLSFISPMLSGKNAYDSLSDDLSPYGGLVRLGAYVLAIVFSLMIMSVVPNKKLFFTIYGSRTLAIYFFGVLIYHLSDCYFSNLRVWQYLVISALLIPIVGNKWFNKILTNIIK